MEFQDLIKRRVESYKKWTEEILHSIQITKKRIEAIERRLRALSYLAFKESWNEIEISTKEVPEEEVLSILEHMFDDNFRALYGDKIRKIKVEEDDASKVLKVVLEIPY